MFSFFLDYPGSKIQSIEMSEDLEYQSERLAEIQDKLNSVTSAAKE